MLLKAEQKDIEVPIHTEVYSIEEAVNLDKCVFIVAATDTIINPRDPFKYLGITFNYPNTFMKNFEAEFKKDITHIFVLPRFGLNNILDEYTVWKKIFYVLRTL